MKHELRHQIPRAGEPHYFESRVPARHDNGRQETNAQPLRGEASPEQGQANLVPPPGDAAGEKKRLAATSGNAKNARRRPENLVGRRRNNDATGSADSSPSSPRSKLEIP